LLERWRAAQSAGDLSRAFMHARGVLRAGVLGKQRPWCSQGLLFEVLSQRYERGSPLVTSNLPFDEWKSIFGSERLTGALLDRLTHHVHILEMNGENYPLATSKRAQRRSSQLYETVGASFASFLQILGGRCKQEFVAGPA
jgi:IstB-like ATP binding protein